MADAIRAKEPLEVGDMEKMTLKLDGITLHNRSVKIEMPNQPGRFVTAEVRDPAFDDPHGPYSAVLGETIVAEVKPMRRPNGDVVKLYVMNLLGKA